MPTSPLRRTVRASVAMLLLLAGAPAHAAPGVLDGAWEGAFVKDEAPWPARLAIAAAGDAPPVVRLDLPQLGMLDEPVVARWADGEDDASGAVAGSLVVEVPFGLGAYELLADGDGLRTRALAGHGIELRLRRASDGGGPAAHAAEIEADDGLVLPGTLYLPDGPPPHAGIVVLHGSAVQGRGAWSYRSWGPMFARLGLATLVYDKRPPERGDDLSRLAADARAAHGWLAARTEVDGSRVGFGGGSQAGWLAARVAAEADGEVAFLLLSGWPAVTPRVQELQSLRNGMVEDGLPPEAVEAAVAYTELMFYVARTGRLWDAFRPLVAEAAASDPWGQYVNQPGSLDDLAWWRRNMDFGGEADLARVRCPALALYGEADWVVPPAENADRLRRALRRAGNDDLQVRVFPGADHRLEVPMHREDGVLHWPRLAPDLLETVDRWLGEHGMTPSR